MYSPTATTNLYASYAKGLSDGGEAPWYTNNIKNNIALQYYHLEALNNMNLVLSNKFGTLLTAAIFDLKQDNQYEVIWKELRFY
jgi:iron complex outermembrane receptor protein